MATAYDETPYPPLSYFHTHPDRLATLATLLGLQPAAVENCRVLEIGCASGFNLLPMADTLPGSHFVGIDASQRQIDIGMEWVNALGLKNLDLRCLDIMECRGELGKFDYIIAHGVYSWVPSDVRNRLLQLCQQLLNEEGVAFISYNTYPGYHLTNIVREAMRYRTSAIDEPLAKVEAARSFIHFLATSIPPQQSAYAAFVQEYDNMLRNELKGSHAAFLLHDELEAINEPVYFHQFAAHAAEYGLQYLVEAELRTVFPHGFASEVLQQLQELAHDTIAMEQYLDMLRNRMFRQSLLCHADKVLDRRLRPQQLQKCSVRSQLFPSSAQLNLAAQEVEQFRSTDGQSLSVDHPVSKVALCLLNQAWPEAVPFDTLLQESRRQLGLATNPAHDADGWQRDALALASTLLQAYSFSDRLVELHAYCPRIITGVNTGINSGQRERPWVRPLIRLQAQHSLFVTNRWHERVALEPSQRQLLQWLDGESTPAELLAALQKLPADARPSGSDDLGQWLAQQLDWLTEKAL